MSYLAEQLASCLGCRRLVVTDRVLDGRLWDVPIAWRFLVRRTVPAPPGQAIQGFGVTDGERHRCPGEGGQPARGGALGRRADEWATLPVGPSCGLPGALPDAGTEGGGE